MTIHRQLLYTGRVQGVGFRYTVKQIAAGYEVAGWVRNLTDGRVELRAGGEAGELEEFFQAIRNSHLSRHIQQTASMEVTAPDSPYTGFEIRH